MLLEQKAIAGERWNHKRLGTIIFSGCFFTRRWSSEQRLNVERKWDIKA